VLPIASEPVADGAVARRGETIVDVGPARDVCSRHPDAETVDHGDAILLPGLVNAHTHLSLTALADATPRGEGFLSWLERTARAARAMEANEVRQAVREGLEESYRLGTALVGEITTRTEGIEEILAHPMMRARVFFEFLGVSEGRARARLDEAERSALAVRTETTARGLDRVRAGLSPHAPYSVWPAHWREAAAFTRAHDLYWSSHIAESPDEDEFLTRGTGPLRDHLVALGVWDGTFPVPGRPAIDLLTDAAALDERALLVHAIHLDKVAIARIAASGASVCLCPRSNAYLGLPPPPVEAFMSLGTRLCLGTDAKASNADLSVWAEMRALGRIAPGIPARRLVEMATSGGARALGFEGLAGTLRPGDRSPLVTVQSDGTRFDDPYEFLARESVEEGVLPL
jgi:cytosine/adenosine deaminase-related metal-dependent hydrolase